MTRKTKSLLLLAAVFAMTASVAKAQTTIRMLKTWGERYPGTTVICDRYAEMLEEASNGQIKVQSFGPETISPLNQFEPTQNGLFQVLCTYPGFHTGETTLLLGLETIKPDPQAFRESGAREIIDAHYADLGLQPLSIPLGHGYWVFLNRPLSNQGDLSGLQIRALPPQHPYIQSLGGTPVVLAPAEMFSALERGVVEGALFPAAGATGYGFAEVTNRYFDAEVTSPHIILANRSFWEGLDDSAKTLLIEQGQRLEDEIPGVYDRLNAEEKEKMAAAGIELLTLSDEAEARLRRGIREGAWAFSESRSGEISPKLREIVESANLLRE